MVTLKRVPRKTKNESGKSLDRELSITSFFFIFYNFKLAVKENFTGKVVVVSNIVSQNTAVKFFSSLSLETQTTTKQQFDFQAALKASD